MSNIHFPTQRLSKNVKYWAEKKNISEKTVRRDFKELGLTKTREQFEADAKIRREMAFNLRQTGLKWKEVGEKLGVSEANAMMLARRHQQFTHEEQQQADQSMADFYQKYSNGLAKPMENKKQPQCKS